MYHKTYKYIINKHFYFNMCTKGDQNLFNDMLSIERYFMKINKTTHIEHFSARRKMISRTVRANAALHVIIDELTNLRLW